MEVYMSANQPIGMKLILRTSNISATMTSHSLRESISRAGRDPSRPSSTSTAVPGQWPTGNSMRRSTNHWPGAGSWSLLWIFAHRSSCQIQGRRTIVSAPYAFMLSIWQGSPLAPLFLGRHTQLK